MAFVEAPPIPTEQVTRKLAWFAVLVAICYAPVLGSLAGDWYQDADMGHGFFVPLIAGFIAWRQKDELLAMRPKPSWWGVPLVLWGGAQLIVGTLGVELFTERVAFVITVIGLVLSLCGFEILKKVWFSLFLLFFMIPIPAIIYNKVTFPLQILASQLAYGALSLIGIPVLREGNILELPNGPLSVVEACSGIRSLLSLTFLALVYGHFFEKRLWLRGLLFLATIPIAIIANGSRVTITGILAQINPALSEGFFHESTGWVIFMLALGILLVFHRLMVLVLGRIEARRVAIEARRTA